MSPSTPRKRSKSLLRELWQLQKEDVPMTATALVEVKYLLRTAKRCITVEIKTPKPRANIIDPNPFHITEEAVPNFILCQLLDQKLIESHNYQDTIALPAALSVVSLIYSTRATTGGVVYPTQFRWHCSRTHRSHLIFAYLDVKMRSRVYSVEELLDLKNASSPNVLAAVAFRDSELAEMLRTKSRVSSRSYNSSSLKRGARKTMDDSSTTSDEVVFKGTIGRRSHRPEMILPAPPAQIIQPIQSTQPVQRASKTVQPNPAPGANSKVSAPAASDGDQPMEWKYRGRSGSEMANAEPLPAPTGADAQQNEGFQRFYKAVVSPTHVRVTAGGRIVPNTRNPVSPTAKRTKDGETITNGTQPEPAPVAAAPAVPKQPLPVMGIPHPMQFFHPGFYPSMPTIHPMSGMPMPMVPPGYPFPMPPVPSAPMAPGTQETSLKENQAKKAEEKDTKSIPEPGSAKIGVKLSPPENFDHTKPFMFNGQQWMFPMFPSPYPGYMGMPPPGFAGPHASGAPLMMPPHMPMPQMMGPMGNMGMPVPQGAMAPPPAAPRQSTPQPPSKPPISSIRPSQITRKQIDGLRANLKYHEDQLQFNKHQIDEKDMENKIQLLQNDIERFERVFKAQADYEEKYYPKSDRGKEDISLSGRSSAAPSTKTSQSQSEESKESKATTVTNSSQSQLKLKKKEHSRDSIGINSNKSSTASYNFDDAPLERFSKSNPNKKSSLPSGAALAPVFQPRSASSVSALTIPIAKSKKWQLDNTGGELTQEQLNEVDERMREAGSKPWGQSRAHELSNPVSQRESPQAHDNLGVPYLIGSLPRNVNSHHPSQRIEYEYSRKLTGEEVQARHLYFGKAPRSVSQGLPKYDGRNFYPASPVKNMVPTESPSVRRQRIQIGVPEADYGFPAPGGKDVDPFRAVTPSEGSLKAEDVDNNNKTPSAMSTRSFNSQADDHTAEFEDALAEASTEDDIEGTHSKGVSETKSADYHDPRANGNATKLWQNMFKRGLTSSDVLPSTISSTTVHGVLPQFNGHAAASLSPSLTGSVTSPSRSTPSKDTDITCNGTSTFMTQKTAENCPPATSERFSDTLLNMVGIKAPAWAS
ncbi:hypothetical protein N0V82_009693 [Gnomoniopsis sp. IMI 355080]|nr:hypothetical protein N0V82_009693 [Gnomoniopsis sp. IMI 355080]